MCSTIFYLASSGCLSCLEEKILQEVGPTVPTNTGKQISSQSSTDSWRQGVEIPRCLRQHEMGSEWDTEYEMHITNSWNYRRCLYTLIHSCQNRESLLHSLQMWKVRMTLCWRKCLKYYGLRLRDKASLGKAYNVRISKKTTHLLQVIALAMCVIYRKKNPIYILQKYASVLKCKSWCIGKELFKLQWKRLQK